jgi:Ca-activated chloride channel homolog
VRWQDPQWLWLIPLAWLLLLPRGESPRIVFSYTREALGLGPKVAPRWWLRGLRALAATSLLVACARPQLGHTVTEVSHSGVDIFLAVDTSGSMRALDLKLAGKPSTRLAVVKHAAAEFVRRRPSDRLGLIVFGENAFVQCPLTLDHDLLGELLNDANFGMAGDGTAVGDAIGIGVRHMKDLPAKSRILILMTDGASNSGAIDPDRAAEIARTYGVKVYTIGVGIEGEAPFLVDSAFGQQVAYHKSDLDEPSLKRIAERTNAKFFRAQETAQLEEIYGVIDSLEKTERKQKSFDRYDERFTLFAWIGLGLLLAEVGLAHTLFRGVP